MKRPIWADKCLAVMLTLVLTAGVLPFSAAADQGVDTARTNEADFQSASTYRAYLAQLGDKPAGTAEITVKAADYERDSAAGAELRNVETGETQEEMLWVSADGSASWQIEVPEAGLYHLAFGYFSGEGNGSSMEREIRINGAVPFDEFRSVEFPLAWKDDAPRTDAAGNEYRPEQNEADMPLELTLAGEDLTPYEIYLEKGVNRISLVSLRGSMLLRYVKLFREKAPLTYEQYLEKYADKEKTAVEEIRIQAENTAVKSESSLYAINDRTSPETYPSDAVKIKLNTVGGYNWRQPGQWIQWDFKVEKSGFYKLSMRAKQNFTEGSYSSRCIYIDGEVPFQELKSVGIQYDTGWKVFTAGGESPYMIWLDEGMHTITLRNTIGDMAGVAERLEEAVGELNTIYRKILMLIGADPDANRDYKLDKTLPECMTVFQENIDRLEEAKKQLVEVTGSKGQSYAAVEKLQVQLRGFVEDPGSIPARLDTFRTNISSVSTWLLTAQEQPLLLDYILFSAPDAPEPRADSPWYTRLWYEVKVFFLSFFNDYNSVEGLGDVGDRGEITLWLGSAGRDQANAMRSLIDNSFTPQTGIRVNVKLVDMGILLPAVVTGNGPDVALGQERTMPMNYAFRGALMNLAEFDDCEEVMERSLPEASTAFRYEDALYALPETFAFSMMFYRKDIFSELSLKVPETWNDLYEILPVLSNNYLDVGFPSIDNKDNNLELFLALLYQNGGSVYNESLSASALTTPEAITAFETWSDFYTKYKVPQKLDLLTRFRTGETPLVITPYTFYNNLMAAAPEISGLWDFTLVPGTIGENGVDHSVYGTGTGAVMFRTARDPEAAWEFLKWWTSEDTQVAYGLEIESLLGPSGRVATANLKALERMSWSSSALQAIQSQMVHARGLEEAPGSYMTARYISTAVRLVINNGMLPREAIMDWSNLIDDEITAKREEFGLD